MTQSAPEATLPLTPSARIDSLDLLRGSAIMGILLMNTQSMSMPTHAYFSPVAYGDITLTNYITWGIIHVLVDVKMLTIFSMMFGAGILLQEERLLGRGESATGVHYRRMIILLLIGLIHSYALWYGDVLVEYAMCGMLLFPFRRLPSAMLIATGVLFICVPVLINILNQLQIAENIWFLDKMYDFQSRILGGITKADLEVEIYRSGWWRQMDNRFWVALDNQTSTFGLWGFWRYGGSMLIGMGLHKFRFFHGQWSREAYLAIAAFCIPAGWGATGMGIGFNIFYDWDLTSYWFAGSWYNYFGSLVTALGYMSVGVLVAMRIAQSRAWMLKIVAAPIRAVGKTALSNYILQALICTTLFYGHGLGWFGYLTRLQLVYVVLSVWALELIASTIWTAIFRQGPLEWAWHKLAHWGRNQPAT